MINNTTRRSAVHHGTPLSLYHPHSRAGQTTPPGRGDVCTIAKPLLLQLRRYHRIAVTLAGVPVSRLNPLPEKP